MRAMLMVIVALALAAPVLAQAPKTGLTIEEQAEQEVWIDEHARWNAEHMTAARRLSEIVASLKRHDTNFDEHGNQLRAHAAATAGRDRAKAARAHATMRAEHEEARSAHHHLMADVDALVAVMAEKFVPAPR